MDKKITTIYIVRHGETEHNLNKIVQGQIDSPLTEKGQAQANNRGLDLQDIKFDAVFSSDLGRARHTAEILKLNRQLATNTTKLLREKFFGTYEGKPEQLFEQENQKLLLDIQKLSDQEKMQFKFEPSQESDDEAASRMIVFLREIGASFLGKTVLVVSHGTIMRSFLKRLGFCKYDELPPKAIENLGYFVLETDGVEFFIKKTVGVNKVKL